MAEQKPINQNGSEIATESESCIGIRWQPLAFALASLTLAAVVGALALHFFVAERLPELNEAALEAAMQRWQQNGPASYQMDIELRGARPGQVHVEVENSAVTLETRDGREPGRWTWGTWSVPGMFDTLGQDLQIATDPVEQIQAPAGTKWRLTCEFDAQYGYPRQYHRFVTGGPEVFWRVTSFHSQ